MGKTSKVVQIIRLKWLRRLLNFCETKRLPKPYGSKYYALMLPPGTIITRQAREFAKGKIDLIIHPAQEDMVSDIKNDAFTLRARYLKKPASFFSKPIAQYLSARAAVAGAAGTGKSKRRGNSKYYSRLAKKAHRK